MGLVIESQVVAFKLVAELDALFVGANRGLTGGGFLREEEDGRGDLAFFIVLVNDMAGRDFLLGFFGLQESAGLERLFVVANERSHVVRLYDELILLLPLARVLMDVQT